MRILTKLGRFGFVGTKLFPSAKAKGINQGSLRDKKQPAPDINNKIDVREEASNKTNSMWKQPITKVTPQMQIERQVKTQLVTKYKQQYSEPKKPQSSQVDRDFTNFQTKQETKEVNQRLKLLLMQRQEIFEKTELLPNYLNRISSLLTPQSFSFNQKQLNDINHNLNNFSKELGSSPLQHLSILKYRYRCRMLQTKFSQAGNHRFIHKATVVCQMLIHKQQLQLNQVIFAMEALLRMGALNVILFVNFTKYMKSIFKEEKKAAKITIQHIVTILNFGIMKRNEITIQNILYGQVLNFLLKNMGLLLKEKHIWMKVEVLNLFLIIDIKQFYIIDRKSKQIQTKKLFREIIQKFQKSNFCGQVIQNESQKAGSHNQEINWKCVLSIVQAINFSLQNRLEQLKYSQQFDSFIKRSVDSIFLNFDNGGQQLKIVKMEQLSYQEKNAIIRILFNVKALEFWLFCPQSSQRVIKILEAMKIKSEESFTPIVDLIYHLNYHSSKLALDKVSKLSEKLYEHYKTSIDLLAMFVALKQNSQKSSRIVNEPGSLYLKYYEKSFKDKLILYLIQKYYNEQVDKNFQKEFQKNVEQQLNNGSLITFYYEAIQYLRNYAIIGNSFCYFWSKINANNLFFQKMKKETNFMKQQYVQLLEILLFDKLNQRQLSTELNQIVQYLLKDTNLKKIFLNRTFPPTYSYFYPYNKKVNLFNNFTEFTTKFKSLIEYYNEERYSYYLWDLLVKHIVRLPQKMRKEAYPLIKSVFFNAFQKDNLRKVVMLTVFTNHICSKTIIASKNTLSYDLNCCVNQLIKAQEVIEYHYRCYLQIVVNALSFGILEQRTFDLLVKHAYQKSPNIKQTTTILLLYGATISKIDGMNNIKTKIKISSQESYLRMLANNKCIEEQTSVTIEDLQKGEEKQNMKRWLTIHISAKVIAIYLRFGIKQILFVEQIVLRYVKQCVELAQWQLIVYSFSPIMFTQPNKQQKQFAQRLLVILREKLFFFREKQLLTQAQYDEFSSKLL